MKRSVIVASVLSFFVISVLASADVTPLWSVKNDASKSLLLSFLMNNSNLTGNYITANYFCNATACWANTNAFGGGSGSSYAFPLNGTSGYMAMWNASGLTGQPFNTTNASYVPYTGATSTVNLGSNALTTTGAGTFGLMSSYAPSQYDSIITMANLILASTDSYSSPPYSTIGFVAQDTDSHYVNYAYILGGKENSLEDSGNGYLSFYTRDGTQMRLRLNISSSGAFNFQSNSISNVGTAKMNQINSTSISANYINFSQTNYPINSTNESYVTKANYSYATYNATQWITNQTNINASRISVHNLTATSITIPGHVIILPSGVFLGNTNDKLGIDSGGDYMSNDGGIYYQFHADNGFNFNGQVGMYNNQIKSMTSATGFSYTSIDPNTRSIHDSSGTEVCNWATTGTLDCGTSSVKGGALYYSGQDTDSRYVTGGTVPYYETDPIHSSWLAGNGGITDCYDSALGGQVCSTLGIVNSITDDPSDVTFKNNIKNMNANLSKFSSIQPVTWTWNSNYTTKAGQNATGLIADDLFKLYPTCVRNGTSKTGALAASTKTIKVIDYACVISIQIAKTQELETRIRVLEQRLGVISP